jgi:uncharacterized protein HemX
MKGLIAVLLVVLLCLVGYNWWQIQTLRQEIARLEQKVDTRQASLSDEVMIQATSALARVQEAVRSTDWNKARSAYDEARAKVEQVARAAGEKSGPALDWLKTQTSALGRQIQEQVPGR